MNDMEFSAKIHQKSRMACEIHDHNADSAVQCDLHNIFAAKKYAVQSSNLTNPTIGG